MERADLYNDYIWDLHSKILKLEKEIEEKKKRLFLSVADDV